MMMRKRSTLPPVALPVCALAGCALGLGPDGLLGQETHRHDADVGRDTASMEAPGEMAGPPALPDLNDLVEVRLDRGAREVRLVVGPVSLMQGDPHLRTPVQLAELPIEGWLHGFEWEITDAEGTVLPERLLHHVNLIDPDRRELFSSIPRRVMAAGRETSSARMPGILGYPIDEGSRVLVSAMFASAPDASYEDAYLHIRLPYTPADDPGLIRPRTVYPFYLDVMGPVGEKEFPLPPGTHGRSWEGSPAVGGRLLAIGGHLHDYADWIRLEDVTAGKVVWETGPERAGNGRVTGVPTGKLWWKGGVRIHADRVYRISVQYTNPLDRSAPDGAMGALGGILLADDGEWPPFDRQDEDYIADLRNTLEKPNEAHGHGHGDHEAMPMEGAGDGAAANDGAAADEGDVADEGDAANEHEDGTTTERAGARGGGEVAAGATGGR